MTISNSFPPLRRPRTLVRAARFALGDFRRERHTKKLLRLDRLPSSAKLLALLTEREHEMETMRKDGDASYSISRHIIMLAALMAEMSLISAASAAPETKNAPSNVFDRALLETV